MKSKLSTTVLVLWLAAFPLLASAPPKPVHVREINFGSIRATYDDLYKLVEQLRQLAELDASDLSVSELMEISDGEQSYRLGNGFVQSDLNPAPKFATTIRYVMGRSSGKITRLELHLSNGLRRISVTGESASSVGAASASAKESIEKWEVFFGSKKYLLLVGVFGFAGVVILLRRGSKMIGSKYEYPLMFAAFGVMFITMCLLIGPFEPLRCRIYSGSASWIDRNVNFITFSGTGLGLIGFIVAWVFWLKPRAASGARSFDRENER